MQKFILTIGMAAVLAACAGPSATGGGNGGTSASKAQADQAIASAEAEMKKAGKMDALWSNTGDILKQAQEAEKAGDFAKAVKLANKAGQHAQLAQAQAQSQANAKPSY